VRQAAGGTQLWKIIMRADVENVERAMFAHPAMDSDLSLLISTSPMATGQNEPRNHSFRSRSRSTTSSIHKPGSALDDGIEDRLRVGRRAANDAEHSAVAV